LKRAVPSRIVSKALCATQPEQAVQYLPCLLVELYLYPIGVRCKLHLYQFGKSIVSLCTPFSRCTS